MKHFLATLALTVLLSGCISNVEPADLAVASYPAAFAAESLAGGDLQVADLASGIEMHDFEPGSRDLDQLRRSTHLILWDETLESWAHRAGQSLGGAAPKAVEISRLPSGETYLQGDEEEHAHDGHGHEDLDRDPHTWTDPLAMRASVGALEAYLVEAYPQHADAVRARAADLTARLDRLHEAFQEGLQQCDDRTVITNHEAHAYLARRYSFELVTLHGIEPGSQPSPSTVRDVIDTIKELGLPAIFIEEGTSASALQAIQDETDVEIRVLHTLETRPEGGDYLQAQQQNIEQLRFAMGCT